MREIKYRMFTNKENLGIRNVCGIMTYNNIAELDVSFNVGRGYSKRDDIKLMQYTDLKDKNYKEIYEGDIVLINGNRYYIQYEIGSFMLVRCSDETDMYEQFKNCWNDDVYPLSQLCWENDCEEDVIYEIEVIGNKFENPELLEEG
jgi:uncharacterized phage protein (TIGR01671 family)